MMDKRKRTFEIATPGIDLIPAPSRKSFEKETVGAPSDGDAHTSGGRRNWPGFVCSRETVLRLIDYLKNE